MSKSPFSNKNDEHFNLYSKFDYENENAPSSRAHDYSYAEDPFYKFKKNMSLNK